MRAQHVRAGLINPLKVEYVPLSELKVNGRSGKIVRLIDERLDRARRSDPAVRETAFVNRAVLKQR